MIYAAISEKPNPGWSNLAGIARNGSRRGRWVNSRVARRKKSGTRYAVPALTPRGSRCQFCIDFEHVTSPRNEPASRLDDRFS